MTVMLRELSDDERGQRPGADVCGQLSPVGIFRGVNFTSGENVSDTILSIQLCHIFSFPFLSLTSLLPAQQLSFPASPLIRTTQTPFHHAQQMRIFQSRMNTFFVVQLFVDCDSDEIHSAQSRYRHNSNEDEIVDVSER